MTRDHTATGDVHVPGRVGVPPAGFGVSPQRTFCVAREAATQDASLGRRDAHPTRESMRSAQTRWALTPLRERLRIVRELRHLIAENADALAAAAAAVSDRPVTEKLVSEILPLADSCRWLEKNAARLLAERRHGKRGRPFWMQGVSFEVERQPFGTVLVIGPENYPLFLPAVHSLHALVSGNAVLLKPAPGTREVALTFASLACAAGLDPALLIILPESIEAARDAIAACVDKVVFTGSSENGREVLALLAETNTPSVMELSGEDAMIVLADADLELVVRALRFGERLNGGETCIAPRRIIAIESIADALHECLGSARAPRVGLGALAETSVTVGAVALPNKNAAARAGNDSPARARATTRKARALPEPRPFPIERAADDQHALALANAADFALGASIFSRDIAKARALAAQIKTGFVLINDLIVPTADPRMPFGGVRASGFGTTRGDEGLLEMTHPHVVAIRRGRRHPHFDEPAPDDAHLFTAYIRAAHGRSRLAAIPAFLRALIAKSKPTNS
ncbi:MAG: aldehyde dehydrogenase family protein [Chthoniobacteraceae bacterium]